jgi:hypothetical protein
MNTDNLRADVKEPDLRQILREVKEGLEQVVCIFDKYLDEPFEKLQALRRS